MLALLLTLACGIDPADLAAITAPPQVDPLDAAIADAVQRQVPLVVLVSADWCQWCPRQKAELEPWRTRRDIAYVVIDDQHPRARELLLIRDGRYTLPQVCVSNGPRWVNHCVGFTRRSECERRLGLPRLGLAVVTAPAERGPAIPSRRPSPETSVAMESRVRRSVAPLSAPKIGASSWLSVNGSDPGAVHQVTVAGAAALVEPNTEQAWREHVAWHGRRDAWSMTPQQLAQAHADAHAAESQVIRRRWRR